MFLSLLVITSNTLTTWFFRLWPQICGKFVIEQAPKFPHKERKLAVVGLTNLLTHSDVMMQEPYVRTWSVHLDVPISLLRNHSLVVSLDLTGLQHTLPLKSFSRSVSISRTRHKPLLTPPLPPLTSRSSQLDTKRRTRA